MLSTTSLYLASVTFLLSFMVGVSSPPGMLKSFEIKANFLMWAALDTKPLFVAFTHFWMHSRTFGSLHASSEVLTDTPAFCYKNAIASGVKFVDGIPVAMSTSTLKVMRADINLFCSPTIMILEQAGHSFLNPSSIGTGATFSPPAPIISSLIRPVILRNLPRSILP